MYDFMRMWTRWMDTAYMCVCDQAHVLAALTKVSARFFHIYIRIFITPFNNIECDIRSLLVCLFIAFYAVVAGVFILFRCCLFVCFFSVSIRLPIHSYAIPFFVYCFTLMQLLYIYIPFKCVQCCCCCSATCFNQFSRFF